MFTWIFTQFSAVACANNGFLFFPTWYKYLPGVIVGRTATDPGTCSPQITGLNDVWLIVAALIEILLRIAALAAVGFIIYGGFQYITSRDEPDKTSKARSTVINALVGLAIALLSTVVINFIAGSVN